MVAEMAKDGLDPSFADAPPNVMRDTLQYIVEKYGSINEYLDAIGFDAEARASLSILLQSPPIPEQNEQVEQVLTQVVDKPALQNAVVTEVITPPDLVGAPPPDVPLVRHEPEKTEDAHLQVAPTLQPTPVLQAPPTLQSAPAITSVVAPVTIPVTPAPTTPLLSAPVIQPVQTESTPLQPLEPIDEHLGRLALQPLQQQKLLVQQIGATTEEVPAFLPLI